MLKRLVAVVVLVCALPCTLAWADVIEGRIVRVLDGDTVSVLTADKQEVRIRLRGIDAPEKKQSFGQVSKQHLSDLVFNKEVTVEFNKQDRYGRLIGTIFVGGTDANLAQVKSGMAWHYRQYAKEQPPNDRLTYAEAEVNARAKKIGLWGNGVEPVAPWDFRHGVEKFDRSN